jgi:hypothetical protein
MLEERIAGQLLVRSTKRFSVAELGTRFYERCLSILHEVEAAESELGAHQLIGLLIARQRYACAHLQVSPPKASRQFSSLEKALFFRATVAPAPH